ncbi:MAG: ArsA family ATPase [Acidimicrobiales bacterium]
MSFFSQAGTFVVTGKGGVGKTTVVAVLANLAARHGLRALVVQLGASGALREPESAHLPRLFGHEEALGWEPIVLRPGEERGEVAARAIRPDTALLEYLHLHGLKRLSRRLAGSGALDVVATAVPGMPDMLVLGKVKQMERAAAAGLPDAPDVIVLDAPAAGHAVRFLQSPRGLLAAAGGGPVRAQAQDVAQMLEDPARCQVLLVTTPEETPVNETIETAQLLEERVGVKLCAVVVNARLPVLALPYFSGAEELLRRAEAAGVTLSGPEAQSLAEAAGVRSQRQASEASQAARLAAELALPQLELPFCFSAELGPEQLEALTDSLASSVGSWVEAS